MSFGEYLGLRLFGEHRTSVSMASGTGLFDQWACRWDPAILDTLEVSPDQLGPIVDLDRPFRGLRPEFAGRWPALARVPWLPALGDGACSNVGAGCTTPEKAALMVGTSGAMRICLPAESVTIPQGLWCYRVDRRRLLLGGSLSNGGSLYAWLTETLRLPPAEEVERELRAMPPDAHGLTVLPFLAGERSVGWVASARAAVVGLSLATRPMDVLRAGLESVAYRFALIHAELREACPAFREVIATGGALLASPAWTAMMADVLGVPLTPSTEAEGSSRGAALLASEALGLIPSLDAVAAGPGADDPARPRAARALPRRARPAPGALRRPDSPRDRREERAAMTGRELDQLCVNTIRFLAADAVQQAKSGHPGLPMGAAPMAYVLWTRFLRHHPANPAWPDRDRFVLSAGHGSMLLYALLHLTGYPLPLEELRRFRQWGSKTPGHPEYGLTPGVEATTGPLGQGLANAVGMAIAERHLAARFNRPDHPVVDHHTYVICSDGDLMEGVAAEAASLAGHLGLGKLIVLYDDNQVSLAGKASLSFSEDVPRRYDGLGWHTQVVPDGNDLDAIDAAIRAARAETGRPSLVAVRTVIGYGAPKKAGTHEAHGEPLGDAELRGAKQALGWPTEPMFHLPEAAVARFRQAVPEGARAEAEWQARLGMLAARVPGARHPVGRRPRPAADARMGPGPPAILGGRRRRRRATRAGPCWPRSRPASLISWAATPIWRPRPRRWSRAPARFSRPRPRGGTSTSACASTRWGPSPTASRITAGCSCSAGPSSSSPTTCARRCGWPRSPSCPSSTCGRTTRSGWGRTGRPISRSSTWRRCAPCRTWSCSAPPTRRRPWWPGRWPSRVATGRPRSS